MIQTSERCVPVAVAACLAQSEHLFAHVLSAQPELSDSQGLWLHALASACSRYIITMHACTVFQDLTCIHSAQMYARHASQVALLLLTYQTEWLKFLECMTDGNIIIDMATNF